MEVTRLYNYEQSLITLSKMVFAVFEFAFKIGLLRLGNKVLTCLC